jgi:hypothetical protein
MLRINMVILIINLKSILRCSRHHQNKHHINIIIIILNIIINTITYCTSSSWKIILLEINMMAVIN